MSLLAVLACAIQANDTSQVSDPLGLSGGATTVNDQSSNAFSLVANNTSRLRRDNFFIGNAFFKQPWVTAPSSSSARDGLGPLFNTNSCQACHVKGGKGLLPLSDKEASVSMLIRLSIPAKSKADAALVRKLGVVPEPHYGDQLQPYAISGVQGEASPRFTYTDVKGQFKDGEPYSLLKPILHLDKPHYGDFHLELQTSVRVAPVMIGLGLLEAIPEAAILANADADDQNKDGISGRANQVWDVKQQKTVLGRFGWKANQPTVEQQTAGAFQGDIGISSPLLPEQNCSATQSDCLKAPDGGKPEISADILEKVVFYASMLAVPARRELNEPQVLQGQLLFSKAGCASCHIVSFTTGKKQGFPELENQAIQPYTDLLLHDMGEGLSDHRPDFLATGSEWRTAPLWGIGLIETVNGYTRYLHDGRARNLLEAILWHGGEAENAKQAVLNMNKTEREALIRFLKSL
jgi:CxxC motif-containing protein (DUF1111 family)